MCIRDSHNTDIYNLGRIGDVNQHHYAQGAVGRQKLQGEGSLPGHLLFYSEKHVQQPGDEGQAFCDWEVGETENLKLKVEPYSSSRVPV